MYKDIWTCNQKKINYGNIDYKPQYLKENMSIVTYLIGGSNKNIITEYVYQASR